ncbi:putative GPI-anchored protein [Camellia lanceoleosa]|uniref:GPI-anchored protein n=1 Tax=Camellia lanceoleosa TaxID=1840588 RepID=A0ACC0F6L9_9ERIC|nr:putative GPI-anchored protein [Camellia lanceoleosa]
MSINLSTIDFAADEKQNLLQGLNSYRASLNLSALIENSNADCFADELASQFKNQPCSNTTGADTVPGTEPQLSNYLDLLAKCQLNITDTRDGALMPVCVPNLDPNPVLTNYTETQYTQYLNESTYIGAGIGAEGNWMVVVLSTNTMGGAFTPVVNVASLFFNVGLAQNVMPLLLVFILVLLS